MRLLLPAGARRTSVQPPACQTRSRREFAEDRRQGIKLNPAHKLARARCRNLALQGLDISFQEREVARSGLEVRQGCALIA